MDQTRKLLNNKLSLTIKGIMKMASDGLKMKADTKNHREDDNPKTDLSIKFRQLELLILTMSGATLASMEIVRYALFPRTDLTLAQIGLDWTFAMLVIVSLVHFSFREFLKSQQELIDKREQTNKAERRLQHIIDMSQDAIFTIKPDGKFSFASKSIEMLTGYQMSDILNMNISDIVAPEYKSFIRKQLAEYRQANGTHFYIDIRKANEVVVPFERL